MTDRTYPTVPSEFDLKVARLFYTASVNEHLADLDHDAAEATDAEIQTHFAVDRSPRFAAHAILEARKVVPEPRKPRLSIRALIAAMFNFPDALERELRRQGRA